jgi:hypothetical protein
MDIMGARRAECRGSLLVAIRMADMGSRWSKILTKFRLHETFFVGCCEPMSETRTMFAEGKGKER